MLHRFAGFELDEERYELRGEAGPVELQPKVMRVLLHLVRNAERTLSREALLDAVWPDVAVGEASLTRCISQARRALGESETDARIIRTVRGRGYRIGVPVQHVVDGAAPAAAGSAHAGAAPEPVTGRRRRALAIGLAVAAGLVAWLARPFADLDLPPRPPGDAGASITAVAVLPFAEIDLPANGRRLGESIALEVNDRLGDITELSLVSPAASFRFGDDGRDPRRIAAELGVGTLVLGRLRPAGERLHVEVEVVDAETGRLRWSHSYEGLPDEILALQHELAREVARVLGIGAHTGAAFARQEPHVDAARYLLEGRVAVLTARRDRLLEAVELYEQAIELDPERVPAYVALAAAYERIWSDDEADVFWLERAEAVSLRAIELDPRSSEAWTLYAKVLSGRRDWQGADEALARALALGPTAVALVELARLRCKQGRPREALAPALRALELDPLSPGTQHTAGRVLYYLGEHERAVTHLRRALQLAPRATYVPSTLASALEAASRPDEASEVLLLALPRWMRPPLRIHQRLLGRETGLRLLLAMDAAWSRRECGRDPYESAAVRAHLGDRERMLTCLGRAAGHYLWYVRSEPSFDPYRDDPRFRRILREAGFSES